MSEIKKFIFFTNSSSLMVCVDEVNKATENKLVEVTATELFIDLMTDWPNLLVTS